MTLEYIQDKGYAEIYNSVMENYVNVIKSNLNLSSQNEYNFKSQYHYTEILEHLTLELGENCLDLIKIEFRTFFDNNKEFLINLCKQNDMIGKPHLYNYPNFMNINTSPSNFRYIYHSLLILQHMKNINLQTVNIIEIGGGYGGLSLFLNKLSHFFDIVIESYSIFDLPYVIDLQSKYLTYHDINVNTFNINSKYNVKSNSFLISNYALSEFSSIVRDTYVKNIVPYCNHGFLIWNTPIRYDCINNIITVEKERPLTGPNNLTIYF